MFFFGRGLLTNKGEDQYMQKMCKMVYCFFFFSYAKHGENHLFLCICLPVRLRLHS